MKTLTSGEHLSDSFVRGRISSDICWRAGGGGEGGLLW